MAQAIEDINLNLSEKYLQKLSQRFDLDDLRRGIYEAVSLNLLRNNLYLEVFKEDKSLEPALNRHLYIEKNFLHFRVDKLIEENAKAEKNNQKKELAEKIYKIARAAVAEFLRHILQQTMNYKNAYAEAEGLLGRYMIVGTNIIRFYVQSKEYNVEIRPYENKPLSFFKEKIIQLKLKVDELKNKVHSLSTAINKQNLGGYFQQRFKQLASTVLITVSATLQKASGMDNYQLAEAELRQIEKQVANIEDKAQKIEIMLNKISPKDLDTVARLAIDLENPEEILGFVDDLRQKDKLSSLIKSNIEKLQHEDENVRDLAQDFFKELQKKVSWHEERQKKAHYNLEEYALNDVEGHVNFHHRDSEQGNEVSNPDVQVYSRRRARKSARQNFFSDWLSGWTKNKENKTHVSTRIGQTNTLDTISILKSDNAAKKNKQSKNIKRTNTVI